MKIEYFHASKYGNGTMVAAEFRKLMAARGVAVNVHHIRETRPKAMPPADLYLFSSPGRCGRPIWAMRRFLKKVQLPSGTKYAILTTEMPTPEGRAKLAAQVTIACTEGGETHQAEILLDSVAANLPWKHWGIVHSTFGGTVAEPWCE